MTNIKQARYEQARCEDKAALQMRLFSNTLKQIFMPNITGGDAASGSTGAFTGLSSAIPIVGGIVSAIAQGFTNRANRKFQEKMYNRERQDALADWNMQNAYNSPLQQMARLKDAGLNPNMVYGTGTAAATGNSGGMPRQSSFGSGSTFQNPVPSDIGSSLFAGAIQQQQLKNLQAQEQYIKSNTIAKSADVLNMGSRTDLNKFELGLKQSLFETIIGQANANLSKTLVNTNIANAQNDMDLSLKAAQIVKTTADSKLALQRIVNLQAEKLRTQAQTKNLGTDGLRLLAQINEIQSRIQSIDNKTARDILNNASQGVNTQNPFVDMQKLLEGLTQYAIPKPYSRVPYNP